MIYARSLLFSIVFYAWCVVFFIILAPFAYFVSPRFMRQCASWWMQGVHVILRLTVGLRHEVRGLENVPEGPKLIVSKHQSAWETLFFHTVMVDCVYGLKEELLKIPLFGWFLKLAGNIVIDRSAAAKAMRSLITGAKGVIEQDISLVLFPEGTRTVPGAQPQYKPGIAALYAALKVPCVPVALNSGVFWPRNSFVKRPGKIVVEFLPVIPAGLDRKTFMRELEVRIEAASDRLLGEAHGR